MAGGGVRVERTMLAVATTLIAILLTLLITRVATVALTATGLSRELARFQARSALTGTGFTTSESESVVTHPVRRRVILGLMLLGNAGLATIIASMMLSFTGSSGARVTLLRAGLLIAGLAVIVTVAKSEAVDARLSRVIALLLRRFGDLQLRDYARLLQLTRDYGVSELEVMPEDWLANRSLGDLKLADEGVLVLGINRSDGAYEGAPRGHSMVHPGDVLVIYGRVDALAELDRRGAGAAGDRAHRQAVAREQEAVREP